MVFCIVHTTRFEYDAPAYESHNELRLAPRDGDGQRLVAFRLDVEPAGAVLAYEDSFGNRVHALSVSAPHTALVIVARSALERVPAAPIRSRDLTIAEFLADDRARSSEQHEFLSPTAYVPFSEPLRRFFWSARPLPTEGVSDYVTRILRFVRDQFEYDPGATHVHSTVDDILGTGGGVCQDFAHLMLGALRLAGVPARYVSGYLAPETRPGGNGLIGEQASHAWVEAMLPGQGWVGFDPTHRCRAGERHLRVAVGRDYADVPPVRGVYRSRGTRQVMRVELHVETTAQFDGWSDVGACQ